MLFGAGKRSPLNELLERRRPNVCEGVALKSSSGGSRRDPFPLPCPGKTGSNALQGRAGDLIIEHERLWMYAYA